MYASRPANLRCHQESKLFFDCSENVVFVFEGFLNANKYELKRKISFDKNMLRAYRFCKYLDHTSLKLVWY